MKNFDEIIKKIKKEREKQDQKWGQQDHLPLEWQSILGEEYGEACKALLEWYFGDRSLDNYEKELIQSAAVSIAALECLQRRNNPKKVYLAGPILNCTGNETHDWREEATQNIKLETINPAMRTFDGDFLQDSKREIVNPDKEDIDKSDILLANCWKPSWGTAMEIFYAWERGKIVISIVNGDNPTLVSPWICVHSEYIFPSLTIATDFINCTWVDVEVCEK